MPIFVILAALSGIWLLLLALMMLTKVHQLSKEKNLLKVPRKDLVALVKKHRFGAVPNTISVILAVVAVALAGLLINEQLLWLAILLPFICLFVRWIVKLLFLLVVALVRMVAKIYKKMDGYW